ncbi:TPA: DNA methyltransferase [Escherichia coli]|nr:site-specific DNA-methyltransferase [Escherichia coli]EEZ9987352.1 site-specific DNA-methyltransferase [Escherichia coli]EFF3335540.1 site-specific DNA-methyltransferase [Escherichia coli]EGR6700260.1 site-specific DNA-methyltransferase [Escherichia coli]HAN1393297.1 site-specific DNA-methyltransferase [Escherichia coli]
MLPDQRPATTELIRELNSVLRGFPLFWNGQELQRSVVIDAINRKQPEIIKALVANEKIKSVYGTEIDGVLIFEFERLCSLLKYKEYWANSYTRYRNKIGLTSEGKYLDYNSDVVLDFPFKDCVLEGGMTKEEQGKDEIYYNEIIARDEIDRLFSNKVFTNIKRYTKYGVEENITSFESDNLIIKGNNLIALHSLKQRYAGKVKLIYIDPPYNTGTDSFKYNDSFNHSTWLSFMKNRVEIAKELLSEDGSIWINLDDNEAHYLKVLMDQDTGLGFVADVIWQKRTSPDARVPLGAGHDHILVYSLNPELFRAKINLIPLTQEQKNRYSNPDNDPNGPWVSSDFTAQGFRPNQMYEIKTPSGKSYYPPEGTCWKNIESEMIRQKEEGKMWFGVNGDAMPRRKTYLKDVKGRMPWTWWPNSEVGHNQEAKKEINALNMDSVFSTPKPERLIQRILHIGSNDGDLVMDFHLGSGTTAAVAHKMGRRYIGIEQMDYIHNITVPRMQKVIDGEQGGISKDVGWQCGGSFLYVELMELNALFVNEIRKAQSSEELEKLFAVMKTEAHLNYQVALENVLSAEYEVDGIFRKVAFCELELHEQKKLLIEILDKNQLYVNASDMDDSDLNISESDKAFTRSFYGME